MVGVLERQASPVAPRRESVDAPTVGTADRLLGLDGIRGLAVVAVVLFHLWPRVAPAGFIGVSVFFTLSGFVITRGLLAEHERTGSISLRSFWARRIRRLWPAASTTLAAVVLIWFVTGWGTRSIGRDVVSSFLQVANWRYLVSSDAYGTGETPVAHFWSLAIEEQLYIVVPIVVWVLRRRTHTLAAVLASLVAGSVIATASADGDANVVYYSTFTRSAELLVGSLLAVASMHLPVVASTRSRQVMAGVAGTVALGVLGWVIVAASLGTQFFYEGGLTLVAVPSVVALAGAIWSPGLVRVLSVRPLRRLGAVSYGIYLIHWPLRVAFANTGISRPLQPWIVLGCTLALAPLSFRFIEEPVRRRQMPRTALRTAAAVLSVVALGGGLAVSSAPAKAREIDFAAAISQLRTSEKIAAAAFPSGRPALPEPVAPPSSVAPDVLVGTPERPLRVGVFGDSTALMLGAGMEYLGDPSVRLVGSNVDLGCPLGRTGFVRGDARIGNDPTTPSFEPKSTCDWGNWVAVARALGGLDVAVVLLGNWDIAGRRVPALGDRWLTVGDVDFDAWMALEMAEASDTLHATGVQRIVWLELPPDVGAPSNSRIDRFNQLVRANAASRPWISVVDYAAYLRSTGREAAMRPDKVHLTSETASGAARDWLNPLLVEIARRPV